MNNFLTKDLKDFTDTGLITTTDLCYLNFIFHFTSNLRLIFVVKNDQNIA